MLMNKTTLECWNILKYETETIFDKSVPLKKLGKRYRKKHLSKAAIRKIVFKHTMWRVYRRTRKHEDHANYKEVLNAAITETRQSKRSCEQKLACNIKKMFFLSLEKDSRTGGHEVKLVKDQCRLDIRNSNKNNEELKTSQ